EGDGAHVAHVETMLRQAERACHATREIDATRVRIDADDLTARIRLPKIGGEKAESAADVEDATVLGEKEVHDREELGAEDREANLGVRALEERQGARDVPERGAAEDLGRGEGGGRRRTA